MKAKESVNLCFRESGYGARGTEEQKYKERVERWVCKVHREQEQTEDHTKYENVNTMCWEETKKPIIKTKNDTTMANMKEKT